MRPPADLAEGVEVQVAAKKKGLGRGLDALLPEADELLPNVVQEIPVGDIDPNTEQPRRSFPEEAMTQLSASVKEQGILGALTGGLKASAAGIAAAVFFGFLAALLCNPKDKS